MKERSVSIVLLFSIIILSGVISGILWFNLMTTSYEVDVWEQISTPEEEGMDATKVDQIIRWIKSQGCTLDSLIVIKNGKMVIEEYPNLEEYFDQILPNRDEHHYIASCTKSVVSSLIGIAIKEGYIENVNQKVVDFFTDRTIANLDERKKNITIEHLLTMRPGLDWYQPFSTDPAFDDPHDAQKMYSSEDFVQFVLDKPMVTDPGETWIYCDGASLLLSAIIQKTTGKPTLDFAREYLFSPLKINDVYWLRSPTGVYWGGTGLHLTIRDMAKIGYLYLNNGTWNNKQLFSADWRVNSTRTAIEFNENCGYGFQWWTYPKSEVYAAVGGGGQRIYVIPKYDMVIAITADMLNCPQPHDGLLHHLLRAVEKCHWTYSNYGFSCQYCSSGMYVNERADIVGPVSNVSGRVEIHIPYWPKLKYAIQWDTVDTVPNLTSVLEDYWEGFKRRNAGLTFTKLEHLTSSRKENHEMIYQEFEWFQQDQSFPGVLGTWYCEESSRLYIVTYYDLNIDLIPNALRFFDSFVCH